MKPAREPSCTNNHDAFRRMLRDSNKGPTDCPVCGWCLAPARATRQEPVLMSDKIENFIQWMELETDFGNWDDKVRKEVHMKLIEFMTEVL
jgi:hypothetical protein